MIDMQQLELFISDRFLKLAGIQAKVKQEHNPNPFERIISFVTISSFKGFFQLTLPLSLATLFYFAQVQAPSTFLHLIIILWAIYEFLFYLYCNTLKVGFGRVEQNLGLSIKEKERIVNSILNNLELPRESIARWFFPDVGNRLPNEAISEWVAGALHNKCIINLTELELSEVQTITLQIEKNIGPAKRSLIKDPKVKFLCNIGTTTSFHKPLTFYLAVSGFKFFGSIVLMASGFQYHSIPSYHFSYWLYEPNLSYKNDIDNEPPIFFIHGIGTGTSLYLNQLIELTKLYPTRRIVALEIGFISLTPLAEPPNTNDTLKAIDYIYYVHGFKKCSFLCHSYGSYICSAIILNRPEYLNTITFVDPVCFASWEADVHLNFFHTSSKHLLQQMCSILCAQDLFMSNSILKSLTYHSSLLLPNEIPCPAYIYLAEKDYLINSPKVYNYIKKIIEKDVSSNIKVELFDDFTHGSYLLSSNHLYKIISNL